MATYQSNIAELTQDGLDHLELLLSHLRSIETLGVQLSEGEISLEDFTRATHEHDLLLTNLRNRFRRISHLQPGDLSTESVRRTVQIHHGLLSNESSPSGLP
jgi:hypothetical protein